MMPINKYYWVKPWFSARWTRFYWNQLRMMFSDDLIDDPEISAFQKMIFSERFRQRLSGLRIEPSIRRNHPMRFIRHSIKNWTKPFGLAEEVMKSLEYFEGKQLDLFKSLMCRSIDLFIAEAIAQNPEAYSKQYVSEFENFLLSIFIYPGKDQFSPYNGFCLRWRNCFFWKCGSNLKENHEFWRL